MNVHDFLTAVGTFLMLTVFFHYIAAFVLGRLTKKSNYEIVPLNERALIAFLYAIKGTILGLLGANRVFNWGWPNEHVVIWLGIGLAIGAVPSIVWVFLYFTGRFGIRGEITEK